jgi:regulator of replication initiation timing
MIKADQINLVHKSGVMHLETQIHELAQDKLDLKRKVENMISLENQIQQLSKEK